MIFLDYLTELPETPREVLLVSEARVQGAKIFAATLARLGILPISEVDADALANNINVGAKVILGNEEQQREDAVLHRVEVREVR